MVEGIDDTQAVVVFVTKRYMDKLMTATHIQDNCKKEFKHDPFATLSLVDRVPSAAGFLLLSYSQCDVSPVLGDVTPDIVLIGALVSTPCVIDFVVIDFFVSLQPRGPPPS